VQKKVYQKP